jgi:hypothetical protein
VGIRVKNLSSQTKGIHFRQKESSEFDMSEEMYFITSGSDELLPCDKNFTPITTDTKFGLHKRLDKFTVEGYITFQEDTAMFFERNTLVEWHVANLGEHDELKVKYNELAREKFEGVYLRALAYSIADSVSEKALVIKRIGVIGETQ